MRTLRSCRSLSALLAREHAKGRTVGFIPTLGALHDGHLSLIRRARKERARVVVSIYVNPLQFGPDEDYARYPRNRMRDKALCEKAGVDFLFCPSQSEVQSHPLLSKMQASAIARPLCGPFRPGHFDGVVTIVGFLLKLIGPCWAYFGKKDYQQYRVIEAMVRGHFKRKVRLIPCSTVRETDGLALSSRNRYLSLKDRRRAPCLFQALKEGARLLRLHPRDSKGAERAMRQVLRRGGVTDIDYLRVVDAKTLTKVVQYPPHLGNQQVVLAGAVRIGQTRLIDNLQLNLRNSKSNQN